MGNKKPGTGKLQELRYVGNPFIISVDGSDKVTGKAKYVGDMVLPGMLYAKVLRSPLPHAKITCLDTSPALEVPGVVAVVTHKNFVANGNFGWPVRDSFILAYEKVRFVGEPIAVVAAETEAAAQAGVAAIAVEFEPLPVVSDMARALDVDAPVIPIDCPIEPGLSVDGGRGGNLCNTHVLRNGDPDTVLAGCPVSVDVIYELGHQEHAYLETEGALAIPEPDGGVTIFANNQSPFVNRDTVAEALGLPKRQVRVIQPPVGGAFGGKDEVLYQTSAQVARLALLSGRPVRLIFTRSESMTASYKRQAMRVRLKLGATAEGILKAAKARMLVDSGAYASGTPLAAWRSTMHAAGPYRYAAVSADTQVVYTNNGYSGAFRGFGNVQAAAAIEMAIDELAYRLGKDPLAFRLQNCLRNGDRTMTGDPIDHPVGLAASLEWVRAHSDWERKRAEYTAINANTEIENRRGIGVACYFHGSGLGGEGVDFAVSTLKVEADYAITLTSGLTDYGQGSRTVFVLLAAEVLGVDVDRVIILRPDTQTAIDSGPTVASRASIVGGNAVRVTAEKLRQTLYLAAANALGCDVAQLERDSEGFVGPDGDALSFEAVVDQARLMGLQLSAEGRWQFHELKWDFNAGTGEPYACYVFGTQAVEVEVNIRTGKTKVLNIWAAHDAGKILYPTGAIGQMYGGIAQGLGYGIMENFRYEEGVPKTVNFTTYRVPRAMDVPEIDATYIETYMPRGPFGAKNLGEPVMLGIAPAIANAIFHATGKRMARLPITPEMIK